MASLTIKVEILSQTLLGSGESWGSFIDSDIVYDEYGLPIFPGRRLKGLLRESAEEVACMLEFGLTNSTFYQQIDSLFGRVNQPSRLRVRNLQVHGVEQAGKWLQWGFDKFFLSKELVLSSLCDLRTQTKIDENGVAEQGTLRKMRVINKGLVFEGELEIEDMEEKDRLLMGCACLALKACGGKRNRGLGEIKCSLCHETRDLCQEALSALERGTI